MTMLSTSRTGPHPASVPLCAAILALTLLAPGRAAAQDYLDTAGRWKTLSTRSLSGFGSDRRTPAARDKSEMFFRDRHTGLLKMDGIQFATSDGGRTWTAVADTIPWPHRIDASGFGVALKGSFSLDSGRTWSHVTLPDVTSLVAWDRTAMAALYVDAGVPRLVVTTDGGISWLRMDSLDRSATRARMTGWTPFGPLPVPDGFTDPMFGWLRIGEFESATRFAVLMEMGQVGVGEAFYYGIIDLATHAIEWTRIAPGRKATRIAGGGLLWDYGWSIDTATGKGYVSHLVHSSDGGRTWDSNAVPSWLLTGTLRSFGGGHFLASNGRTRDFGKTWEAIVHHYYPSRQEYVIDTAAIAVANSSSLFAMTTDGGVTWRQNASGAIPKCVAACDSRVVVGRDFRSALFSPDSGETWTELGSIGALPEYLTTLWALAYPDSVNEPFRVLGVGGFHYPGRRYEVHIIESLDGGRTWSDGARIPELEKGLGPYEGLPLVPLTELDHSPSYASTNAITFTFAPLPDRSGNVGFIAVQRSFVRSTDGGHTWTETCDSITFGRLRMADALRGVATSAYTIRRTAAIYSTSDGGSTWNRHISLQAPVTSVIDIGAPGGPYFQILARFGEKLYSFRSSDYGENWRQDILTRSGRYAGGELLWLDTADIHVMRANGEIYHSTNAGENFRIIHPASSGFSGIKIGFDGSYVYLASSGNVYGRWRIARRARRISDVPIALAPEPVLIAPNPATTHLRARLPFQARGQVEIIIGDLLGRTVAHTTADPPPGESPELFVDVSSLASGAYVLRITDGDRSLVSPVIVEGHMR